MRFLIRNNFGTLLPLMHSTKVRRSAKLKQNKNGGQIGKMKLQITKEIFNFLSQITEDFVINGVSFLSFHTPTFLLIAL